MATRVVEFSNGGIKLERVFSKNQHIQRKFLNFENWTNSPVEKNIYIFSTFGSKINDFELRAEKMGKKNKKEKPNIFTNAAILI